MSDEAQWTVAAPDLVGVGAESIVERAQALGLTWTLRPATVSVATTEALLIAYDAPTDLISTPITAVNLTGQGLAVGTRVMGLVVPPSGNYVIGFPTMGGAPSNGFAGALAGRIDSIANSASVTAEAAVLTIPNVTFRSGRAYRWQFWGKVNPSVINIARFQVRRGSVAGTLLTGSMDWNQSLVGVGEPRAALGYVKRLASTDTTDAMVLTLTAVGLGALLQEGSATFARFFEVYDAGPATNYANASVIT